MDEWKRLRNFFEKINKATKEDIVNFIFNNINKIKKLFLQTLAFILEMGYT
ncbi:hypothetical protein [Streptococcus infantis]|uniref:hypothetical protein n=1 Tax=Streptococcus infantis TaxID=68892 RepID=UPI0039C12021